MICATCAKLAAMPSNAPMSKPAPSIAVAIVSRDRQTDLARLLDALGTQTLKPASVHIVDSSQVAPDMATSAGNVHLVRSEANLGGAGGFTMAILQGLASGAEWIWLMDDDAAPVGNDCLQTLLNVATSRGLDVVSPLIVAPEEPHKLSFPFRIKGKFSFDLDTVRAELFIPNTVQFFNGALIHRSTFYRIGLPDMKMFVRGDEVEFMLRLRRAAVPFGTACDAIVAHPPGWGEVHWVIQDRMLALVPENDFKRYYFFRNRGYMARRYRRLPNFLMDLVIYPFVFVFRRRWDWPGLRLWARAFFDGLTYRFDHMPDEVRNSGASK